jgi:hypothetical protein
MERSGDSFWKVEVHNDFKRLQLHGVRFFYAFKPVKITARIFINNDMIFLQAVMLIGAGLVLCVH